GIVVNGGFDPVALVANVGDTLLVAITRAGFTEPLRAAEVVRRGRRPVVVRTSPPRGGRDVPLNANIVIVFSTPISTTTLTTASVTLWHGTTPLAGTVRFADDADLRAEFHADTLLTPETQYQLVVTTAILDVNGLALDSNVTVPFTTGTIAPATNLVFASVSGGYNHTCGLTTTGAAYCWGDGFYGQRGDGDTATVYPQTPVPVAGGLTFAAVSAGGNASCGVTTTGVAYCWGMNAHGQLGVGTSTGPERCQNPGTAPYSYACSTVPVAVAGGLTFKGVIAGYGVTCGVTTSGAPYCWGENLYGALGNGTNTG